MSSWLVDGDGGRELGGVDKGHIMAGLHRDKVAGSWPDTRLPLAGSILGGTCLLCM